MEPLRQEARRGRILELLERDRRVQVAQLSELLGASEVTIRSDLKELERQGLLQRVHGGATPMQRGYLTMTLKQRKAERAAEKKRIACEAASRVAEGETLLVNSGTTTLFTALELKRVRGLKLVTNSIAIASELSGCPNADVLLLGGRVNPAFSFTYGSDALSQLREYRADTLILSVDGVDAEGGLTTYHCEEAELDRAMIERARSVCVVADYTKIGCESFARVADIERADWLITNTNAAEAPLSAIRARGVEIIKA